MRGAAGSASWNPDSSTDRIGTTYDKVKVTGPGLTGHMSPSLVPWGGFVVPASFHELPTVLL